MKKIFSLLLAVAMIATMIPTLAVGAFAKTAIGANDEAVTIGEGNAAKEYQVIRHKDDLLAYFADKNDAGNVDKNMILAADIDMGGYEITAALATLDGVTIDGNGYSIHNFKMTGTTKEFSMFEVVTDSEITICNITFGTPSAKIVYNYSPSANTDDAGMAGFFFDNVDCETLFENVTVYTTMNNTTSYAAAMGVIAGYIQGTHTIKNVNVYGSISGYLAGNCAIGAYVGSIRRDDSGDFLVENCSNYATITAANNHKAGGFVGQIYHAGNVTFKNCVNYGNVTDSGKYYVGGFVGQATCKVGDKPDWKFIDCLNYGAITGAQSVSGLIGAATPHGKDADYDKGITMTRCVNYGTINATSQRAGGMIGNIENPYFVVITIEDSANFGTISNGQSGGAIGYSLACNPNSTETASVIIKNFLNMGDIFASNAAGGLVGYARADKGKIGYYTVENCVNFGKVSGKQQVGGFFGYTSNTVTITNSLNAGSVTANDESTPGNFVGVESVASGTGNFYVPVSGANTDCATTALTDLNAAIKKYNDEMSAAWGKVILNDNGNGVVLANPAFVGVQNTAIDANNEYSVRFASVIDTARYSKVGYLIKVNGAATPVEYSCKNVYQTINGTVDGKVVSYTAEALGGAYIYALNIDKIPASGTYTFQVTPFATDLDTTTVYTGTTYTVTYVDGVYSG